MKLPILNLILRRSWVNNRKLSISSRWFLLS